MPLPDDSKRDRGGHLESSGNSSLLYEPSRAMEYQEQSRRDEAATEASPLVASHLSSTERHFLHGTNRRQFWIAFSQVLVVQFIGCFDGTILSSSHPAITSEFGVAHSASWLSTTFLLTSTVSPPLLGRLSDAVGRKPLFLGCISVFVVATAWCAAAGSFGSFIAARAVCGFGAGGGMSLGQIITSDLVPIEYVVVTSTPTILEII